MLAHREWERIEPGRLVYEQLGDTYDGFRVSVASPDVTAPIRSHRRDGHVGVPVVRFIVDKLDHLPGIVILEPYEMVVSPVSTRLNLGFCLGKVDRLVIHARVAVLLEVRDGMFGYFLLLPGCTHLFGLFEPVVPRGGLTLGFLWVCSMR